MCKRCEYTIGKRVLYLPHNPQSKHYIKKQKMRVEEKTHIIRNLYAALFTHLSTTLKYKIHLLYSTFTHLPQQLLLLPSFIYKEEL